MVLSEAIYLANLLASATESAEWIAQRAEPVIAGRPQPAAQKLNVNMVYYTWEIVIYSMWLILRACPAVLIPFIIKHVLVLWVADYRSGTDRKVSCLP